MRDFSTAYCFTQNMDDEAWQVIGGCTYHSANRVLKRMPVLAADSAMVMIHVEEDSERT